MCIRDRYDAALSGFAIRIPDEAAAMIAADANVAYVEQDQVCLLYTSDAADERSSVDLGGSRIIKKKKKDSILSVTEQKSN
mgnify:CR=1 FL=1